MGKLQCFTINGIEMWFFSNDHLPPHFHAKRKGQWEVKVNFLASSSTEMFQVVWPKGKEVPKTITNLLEKMVNDHRDELLKEWELKVKQQ